MTTTIDTDNFFSISGTILRINVYGQGGSAANLVIGMADDADGPKSIKFFDKDVIAMLRVGMPVTVFGKIGSNRYTDKKTGEVKYRENNDIIAKTVKIRETKAETMDRELTAIYG